MIRALRRQLTKSLSTRGVLGTCRVAGLRLISAFRTRWRGGEPRPGADQYDAQFGVDTGGCIPLSHLDIRQSSWVHGVRYEPIGAGLFREALGQVPLRPEGATFVDLGSGKGRAVLLAAELPYKRVVGVEFSRELTEIARGNLERYPRGLVRARAVEFVCADAAEFSCPATPIVLYLYNPFNVEIMRRVAANVTASLRALPRPFVVLYVNPQCPEPWDATTELVLRRQAPQYRIYVSASLATPALPSHPDGAAQAQS